MKGKSDRVLTNNHSQMSQESNSSFASNTSTSFKNEEKSYNFHSNPFETGIIRNDLKKFKTTSMMELEKEENPFVNKVTVDLQSSQNKAIDALEQFKCTVRSRQPFKTP